MAVSPQKVRERADHAVEAVRDGVQIGQWRYRCGYLTRMSDCDVPTYNGRTARQHATDAENSLLGIVHLAEADETPLDARQIFGTLSGITRMLEHVPEVITRMRAAALHQHEAGNLTIAAGRFAGDPDAAAQALADAVDAVLAGFGTVRMNMEKAQASLSDASFDGGVAGGGDDVA